MICTLSFLCYTYTLTLKLITNQFTNIIFTIYIRRESSVRNNILDMYFDNLQFICIPLTFKFIVLDLYLQIFVIRDFTGT